MRPPPNHGPRRALSRSLALALAGASALAATPPAPAQFHSRGIGGLEQKPLDSLRDNEVSALGQQALAIRPADWRHAETENFVYHFFESFIATPVSVEAEFYYRIIAADLKRETASWERKCHIFIFDRAEDWTAFRCGANLEPWTGGIHALGELFLLRNREYKFKGSALGHEIAHLVLHRFFGPGLPLWLNEGYCEYISSIGYAAYHRARGYAGKPRAATLASSRCIPLARLFSTASYPRAAAEVETFYAQSEHLVRLLVAHDKNRFLALLEQLSNGARLESALGRIYPGEFDSTAKLEAALHRSLDTAP